MTSGADKCARCDHLRSDHCKGNALHGDHKDEQRMIPLAYRKGLFKCTVRHCLQPICSCVDFIEPERKINEDPGTGSGEL